MDAAFDKPNFGGQEWPRAQRVLEKRHLLMHPRTPSVGNVILSKATSYTAGRVGIGLTVYAGLSYGVLELLEAFLTPFATTTLWMARLRCIDPLDGKRRQ